MVITLLATFGCSVTCQVSSCILKLYAMFLTLIFLVKLITAIIGFLFRHDIKNIFINNYEKALNNITLEEITGSMQPTTHKMCCCCGVTNYRDITQKQDFSRVLERFCKLEDCLPLRDAGKVNNEGCFIKLIGIFLAYSLSYHKK
uniref:Tetraspanin-15 n=1 Tax=Castor canadensis TaxID=51338 RepID=A0A8C0WJM5_CASCN